MAQGLNVSDAINVQVNIGTTAVQTRSFGTLMIAGSTPGVIDTSERYRSYGSLDEVAGDFGLTAPEYLAAEIYFSQEPQPQSLMVGFWAQAATSGVLHGAILSAAQMSMTNFNAITNGAMTLNIDGTPAALSGLNFAAATNLSMVAAVVNTGLSSRGTCTWDGERFNIHSATTGVTSTVGYATGTGSGTDVSALLGLVSGAALSPVNGVSAESALSATQTLADATGAWYGLVFATPLTDTDHKNIAAFIEGANPVRLYGITLQNSAELATPNNTSLGYQLSQLKYARTWAVYSSSNSYAAVGLPGRAFTVDFTGENTTITLKWKQVIGVAPENLTESQARALKAINVNIYVNYNNGGAIIQEGQMIGGRFFDEVHALDWLSNAVQVGQFNLQYTTATKIPQTDQGMTTQLTQLEADLHQAVRNGLLAPGVWNSGGFGNLSRGDTLTKGFYTYAPPYSTQSQADREARKSVTMQAALKGAGAVHFANIILNVNR